MYFEFEVLNSRHYRFIFLVSYLQNVLRELEQKKPQLDDLVKTAENLRESPIRQQIPEKGKFTTDYILVLIFPQKNRNTTMLDKIRVYPFK